MILTFIYIMSRWTLLCLHIIHVILSSHKLFTIARPLKISFPIFSPSKPTSHFLIHPFSSLSKHTPIFIPFPFISPPPYPILASSTNTHTSSPVFTHSHIPPPTLSTPSFPTHILSRLHLHILTRSDTKPCVVLDHLRPIPRALSSGQALPSERSWTAHTA